jgi:UDP-glucose 4-epimerase
MLRSGAEVSILDRPGSNLDRLRKNLPRARILDVALADTGAILAAVDSDRIDAVIHLVSSLLPAATLEDFEREQREVIAPTFRLLGGLAKRGVKFVFISSGGTVYGRAAGRHSHESDALAPINLYGMAKAQLEAAITYHHRVAGLDHLVLRPSNPFGRFQPLGGAQGFVSVALSRALAGRPIEVWGDGSTVRDYVSVDDLAFALVELLAKGVSGASLNVGSGVGHSLLEVIAAIEEVTGKRLQVDFKPGRTVDVPSTVLDIGALRSHLAFTPLDLREGLRRYCRWLEEPHAT